MQGARPGKSDLISDEIPATDEAGVKEPPVLSLRQPVPPPDKNRQDLLKPSESTKMDALKEAHPGPSLAPKLFFPQPMKKQKKNFDQEKTEMDIMHEEMQKMKKEMS